MPTKLKTPDLTPAGVAAFLQPILTLIVAFGLLDAGQADAAVQIVIGAVSLGVSVMAFVHDVLLRRNRAKYLGVHAVEDPELVDIPESGLDPGDLDDDEAIAAAGAGPSGAPSAPIH
jgi:hypothetical protein